mmetsp:Transcript_570/g.2211  ORF Transcript_570/g.2211 Transcript_570/m.2211 type:complete len:274 (+) Transcript_570:613-1434(+)
MPPSASPSPPPESMASSPEAPTDASDITQGLHSRTRRASHRSRRGSKSQAPPRPAPHTTLFLRCSMNSPGDSIMMSSRSATPETRLPILRPTPLSSPAESNEYADSRAADFSVAGDDFHRSAERSLFHAIRASVSAASSANASSTAHRLASSSFATANKSTNELSFLTGKTISPLASRPSGVTTASIRLLFSSSSSLNRASAVDAHSRESSMVPMPTPATWASMNRRHVSEIAVGSFAESTTEEVPPFEPPAPSAGDRDLTRSGVLGSRSSRR